MRISRPLFKYVSHAVNREQNWSRTLNPEADDDDDITMNLLLNMSSGTFFYMNTSEFLQVFCDTCRNPEQNKLIYCTSPTFLEACRIRQVEDFYNSHGRRVLYDIEACLNMHTYQLQPKESV